MLYAKVIGSFSFSKNSYRVRKKTKCLSLEVFCGFVYIVSLSERPHDSFVCDHTWALSYLLHCFVANTK